MVRAVDKAGAMRSIISASNLPSISARQPICLARYMLSPVRPSVCPSFRRVDHTKKVEVRIMKFTPFGSPIPLVFAR